MIIEALEVLWSMTPARRLLGAVLVSTLVTGTIAGFAHVVKQRAFDRGYRRAADSVWLAETKHRQVLLDSMESRADSIVNAARRSDSVVKAASRKALTTLATAPHVRIDTVRVAVDTVPLVSVFVESDSASYPAHPRLAALLVWQDSLIHQVAVPLIARQQGVIAQLDTALDAEHAARIGADSLTAAWRLRALSAQPTPARHMSWQEKALHAAVWTALVLTVRNQIHRR